jgi:intracellular sulfur oxidation DsrE/DsrF family protein
MTKDLPGRRSLMSSIGAFAAAFAIGSRRVGAQAPAASTFEPARHAQDGWLDAQPGKHRVVLDVTSAGGVPDAIRFAGNIFNGNTAAYGLDESEVAMVVILRHSATAFGYANAIWARHGAALAGAAGYTDADSAGPPAGNPFTDPQRGALDALAARGVQFAVCNAASSAISRRLAGQTGDAEATYNEMVANMIPNSRLVPAGVIAVTRAQEYGYGAIHVG